MGHRQGFDDGTEPGGVRAAPHHQVVGADQARGQVFIDLLADLLRVTLTGRYGRHDVKDAQRDKKGQQHE